MEFAPFAHSSLVCAANAFGKAADAASRRGDGIPVVGADTIVVLGQDILGKPENQEDAFCMLRALSGKPTQSNRHGNPLSGKTDLTVTSTEVRFRQLEDEEIRKYIETGEPMDKAGAYGIQGIGTLLVESIHGSYDNVVGLPLAVLYEKMGEVVG